MNTMSSKVSTPLVALMVALAALLIAGCGVEPIFSYQGYLTDADGNVVADGTYDATFRLFSVATGGTALYSEDRSITVEDGLFDTSVGDADIPTEIYANQLWLEVAVEGETLSPRQPLRGAPYAFSLASGAVVQGIEPLDRELLGQPDTGAALVAANADSSAEGGHGLIGVNFANSATAGTTAALVGSARGNGYGGYFQSEAYRGLYAEGADDYYSAVFMGGIGIYVEGDCTGCSVAYVAQNIGDGAIAPGDLVAAAGVTVDAELGTPVLQVRRATGVGDVVIGVASGAMTRSPVSGPDGLRAGGFDPSGGEAAATGYLGVVVQGLAQVKVDGAVAIGDGLAAGRGGALVATGATASVARAMSAPDANGMVWAMISGR